MTPPLFGRCLLRLFDTAPVSFGGYLTPGGVIWRLFDTAPFFLFSKIWRVWWWLYSQGIMEELVESPLHP